MTTDHTPYRCSPAVLLCLLLALLAPAAHASVLITGQVVDADTGKGLSYVEVALYRAGTAPPESRKPANNDMTRLPGGEVIGPAIEDATEDAPEAKKPAASDPLETTSTRETGSFALDAPAPGSYEVVFPHPRPGSADSGAYEPTSQAVNVTAAGVTGVVLPIQPGPGLRVALRSPDGTDFMGSTQCEIWSVSAAFSLGVSSASVTVSADGLLRIPAPESLKPGERCVIEVRAEDTGVAEFTVVGWSSHVRHVDLQTGGSICTTARDQSGTAIPDANIQAIRLDAAGVGIVDQSVVATADDDGAYKLSNLLPGDYLIFTRLPGGATVGWKAKILTAATQITSVEPADPVTLMSGGNVVSLMSIMDRVGVAPKDAPALRVQVLRGSVPAARVIVGLTYDSAAGVFDAGHGGRIVDDAKTDANGVAVVRAPRAGAYLVGIMDPLGPPDPHGIPVRLAPGLSTALVIHLLPLPHVHLVGADGKPLTLPTSMNVDVHISTLTDDGMGASLDGLALLLSTGEIVGLFTRESIEPSHIRSALIEVRAEGFGVGSVRVDPWDDKTHEMEITPGATLSGMALDEAGHPVAFAPLDLSRLVGQGLPWPVGAEIHVHADQDGKFKAGSLFPGRYLVSGSVFRSDMRLAPRIVHTGPGSVVLRPGEPDPVAAQELEMAEWFNTLPKTEVVERLAPDQWALWPSISGRVVDAKTGKPLAHALVRLVMPGGPREEIPRDSPAVLTGLDGAFKLRTKTPGNYPLNAHLRDFVDLQQSVVVGAGSTAGARKPVVLRLEHETTVWLQLLKPDGRPAPPGIAVTLSASIDVGQDQDKALFLTTDQDGMVGISRAVDNRVMIAIMEYPNPGYPILIPSAVSHHKPIITLIVAAPGLGVSTVHLNGWQQDVVRVNLVPAGDLSGILIGFSGRPQEKQSITLTRSLPDGSQLSNVRATDSDGRFDFPLLPPGRYLLESLHSRATVDVTRGTLNIILAPFEASPVPVPRARNRATRVGRPVQISGQVLESGSRLPLPGSLALLYGSDPGAVLSMGVTGTGGAFYLNAPCPGSYRVGIVRDGQLESVVPISVSKSGIKGLSITVGDAGALHFQIVGPGSVGNKFARVAIAALSPGFSEGSGAGGAINSDGRLVTRPLLSCDLSSITRLEYWVRVPGVGYAYGRSEGWPTGEIVLSLSPGCTLKGRVVDEAGVPLDDVSVRVVQVPPGSNGSVAPGHSPAFPTIAMARTGPDGAFEIAALLPGPYTITAETRDGYQLISGRQTGALPQIEPVQVTLNERREANLDRPGGIEN